MPLLLRAVLIGTLTMLGVGNVCDSPRGEISQLAARVEAVVGAVAFSFAAYLLMTGLR